MVFYKTYSLFSLKFQRKQAVDHFVVRILFCIAFLQFFWYDTDNLRFGGLLCGPPEGFWEEFYDYRAGLYYGHYYRISLFCYLYRGHDRPPVQEER